MILLVLYGAHSSRLLSLTVSPILITTTHQHPPSKITFDVAANVTTYVGNEWDTVSKISKYFNTYLVSLRPNTNITL